jgi:AcrR family transcriptional regulator
MKAIEEEFVSQGPVACESPGVVMRRGQILDAAREAFRIYGFHAASMAIIAQLAHMSVGQIYRYFENKEAIVSAIIEEHVAEAKRDLTMLAKADGELAERIADNFCLSVARYTASGFGSMVFEVRAEASRQPHLRAQMCQADSEIYDRIIMLMKTTALQTLSDDELLMRAERICLIFEGALMRLCRGGELTQAHLQALITPMIRSVLEP